MIAKKSLFCWGRIKEIFFYVKSIFYKIWQVSLSISTRMPVRVSRGSFEGVRLGILLVLQGAVGVLRHNLGAPFHIILFSVQDYDLV